jgi:hypothetical protein
MDGFVKVMDYKIALPKYMILRLLVLLYLDCSLANK